MNKGLGGSQDRVVFEALEPRLLLDGNVAAKVVNGDLRIIGDRRGNSILIERGGTTDTFIVTGRDGTAVNGGLEAILTGVTDDITIRTKGGDDEIKIDSVIGTPDDLIIKTGPGTDVVELVWVIVQGKCKIRTGAGDGAVMASDSMFNRFDLRGSAGLNEFSFERSHFYGTTKMYTAGFTDFVGVFDSEFRAEVTIKTGSGCDYLTLKNTLTAVGGTAHGSRGTDHFVDEGGNSGPLDRKSFEVESAGWANITRGNVVAKIVNGDLRLTGDADLHSIEITQLGPTKFHVHGKDGTTVNTWTGAIATGVTDDIIINLKGARNDIWLHDLTIPDSLKIKTRSGGDVITMENVTVTGGFTMRTGARHDYMTIADLVVGGTARIKTGSGDDMLDIDRADFYDRLWAGFGSGADDLDVYSSGFSNVLSISMGGQDDYVSWVQCWSPLGGGIYGGKGDDWFHESGTTTLPTLYGFESIT